MRENVAAQQKGSLLKCKIAKNNKNKERESRDPKCGFKHFI